MGTVERGLMYPIPARERWALAVGGPVFDAILVVMAPAMADGEAPWGFAGGLGLLMVAGIPWLIKLARDPSYLAATRSGITTTAPGAPPRDVEVHRGRRAVRHPPRTRRTNLDARWPATLTASRGSAAGSRRWAAGGCAPTGLTRSWPTWQFDADPEDMAERLNGYLADPDSRPELDAITAEHPAAAR